MCTEYHFSHLIFIVVSKECTDTMNSGVVCTVETFSNVFNALNATCSVNRDLKAPNFRLPNLIFRLLAYLKSYFSGLIEISAFASTSRSLFENSHLRLFNLEFFLSFQISSRLLSPTPNDIFSFNTSRTLTHFCRFR